MEHNLKLQSGVISSGGRNSPEDALAKIWAEVLGLTEVDPDANFFDIGGDSMKAMDVIVRVAEVLRVELPLMAFFEDPTLTHLSSVIDELTVTGAVSPVLRVSDRAEFPLAHSQQVFWLLEQQHAGTGLYNTARIFRVRGRVDSVLLERSLNEPVPDGRWWMCAFGAGFSCHGALLEVRS